MELYLMQHGACLSTKIDPDQPLSPVGRDAVAQSAQAVSRMGLTFDAILCSPKTRARQTATILAETLRYPPSRIHESDTFLPMASPRESLEEIKRFEKARTVLVCGHLPSLLEIAALLTVKGGKLDLHFENAGLMRLDLNQAMNAGKLIWSLSPSQLQLIARTD